MFCCPFFNYKGCIFYHPDPRLPFSEPIKLTRGGCENLHQRGRIKSANLLRCLRTQYPRLVLRRQTPVFSIDTLFLFDIGEYQQEYQC